MYLAKRNQQTMGNWFTDLLAKFPNTVTGGPSQEQIEQEAAPPSFTTNPGVSAPSSCDADGKARIRAFGINPDTLKPFSTQNAITFQQITGVDPNDLGAVQRWAASVCANVTVQYNRDYQNNLDDLKKKAPNPAMIAFVIGIAAIGGVLALK